MAQIDGAGQQDTDTQNAEALQAALAQREVTLQGQPQGGSDVPIHQNSDPVSDESEILRPYQALTGKRRVPFESPYNRDLNTSSGSTNRPDARPRTKDDPYDDTHAHTHRPL